MSKHQFFITGTDTEVGKTFASCSLLHALNQAGYRTAGFKPVSAGCEQTENGLRNEDARALQAASSVSLAYDWVNPIALEPPVAPHLAAAQVGFDIQLDDIHQYYARLQTTDADVLLTEGAGGWRLPLGNTLYLSDFVKQQNMPVILVVGMRLGCLNHAILTAEAILADGVTLAGWVANQIDPNMPFFDENVAHLTQALPAPLLCKIPWIKIPWSIDLPVDSHNWQLSRLKV